MSSLRVEFLDPSLGYPVPTLIDERDFDPAKHKRIDPEPERFPVHNPSPANNQVIAVRMLRDRDAPLPTLISIDEFDARLHEVYGDGSIPKPPEPEPEIDPMVALAQRVEQLEKRVAVLEGEKRESQSKASVQTGGHVARRGSR